MSYCNKYFIILM
jgi:hypothetical protein